MALRSTSSKYCLPRRPLYSPPAGAAKPASAACIGPRFSHDRSAKPVVQRETIHNRGRKLDGPPPLEGWISWVDPKTPEPDFRVPLSLGWPKIVE